MSRKLINSSFESSHRRKTKQYACKVSSTTGTKLLFRIAFEAEINLSENVLDHLLYGCMEQRVHSRSAMNAVDPEQNGSTPRDLAVRHYPTTCHQNNTCAWKTRTWLTENTQIHLGATHEWRMMKNLFPIDRNIQAKTATVTWHAFCGHIQENIGPKKCSHWWQTPMLMQIPSYYMRLEKTSATN